MVQDQTAGGRCIPTYIGERAVEADMRYEGSDGDEACVSLEPAPNGRLFGR